MKLFIDSDVILDLLTQRATFSVHSTHLFNLLAQQKNQQSPQLQALTTPIVFANVYYILRKQFGDINSRQKLISLRHLIDIMPMNESIVDTALLSNFKDFEDALQIITAEQFDIDIIITRNYKDYKNAEKPVYNALEFLQFFDYQATLSK